MIAKRSFVFADCYDHCPVGFIVCAYQRGRRADKMGVLCVCQSKHKKDSGSSEGKYQG